MFPTRFFLNDVIYIVISFAPQLGLKIDSSFELEKKRERHCRRRRPKRISDKLIGFQSALGIYRGWKEQEEEAIHLEIEGHSSWAPDMAETNFLPKKKNGTFTRPPSPSRREWCCFSNLCRFVCVFFLAPTLTFLCVQNITTVAQPWPIWFNRRYVCKNDPLFLLSSLFFARGIFARAIYNQVRSDDDDGYL